VLDVGGAGISASRVIHQLDKEDLSEEMKEIRDVITSLTSRLDARKFGAVLKKWQNRIVGNKQFVQTTMQKGYRRWKVEVTEELKSGVSGGRGDSVGHLPPGKDNNSTLETISEDTSPRETGTRVTTATRDTTQNDHSGVSGGSDSKLPDDYTAWPN
jgi:hypothetical protein